MENSTFKNDNLKKYGAVAGAFLASGVVNAQINYTDVNPDQVVNLANSPFALDMDGDTNDDLGFIVGTFAGTFSTSGYNIAYTGGYAAVVGQTSNGAGTMSSAVAVLSSGAMIDSNMGFTSSGSFGQAGSYYFTIAPSYGGTWTYGAWLGQTDKFMGVSFTNGSGTHYGWVRLDVASDATSITIKDYAYNDTPDGPIMAGQMVGLEGIATEDKVSFKTLLDHTVVNVTPDLIGQTVSMVDLMGNEISSTEITDVNTTVQYGDIKSGVYMIVVTSESDSVSKKVYVK